MSLDRLIFDCIDPCFVKEDQEKFDRNEAAIAKRATLIFCTARSLHERMLAQNSRSFLVPNGCHVETYEACRSPATLLLTSSLRGRKRPYIGYMGTVDWRFDAATVTEVARQMPDCTFVVVGRVNQDQETNIRELRQLANVVITGAASYDEGHAYTKAFDVGIVPFIPGPMNDAINSVKMYMYLAAGKPVVSTWLAECGRAEGVRESDTNGFGIRGSDSKRISRRFSRRKGETHQFCLEEHVGPAGGAGGWVDAGPWDSAVISSTSTRVEETSDDEAANEVIFEKSVKVRRLRNPSPGLGGVSLPSTH